jgi:phosphate transport system permease protein
MSTTQRSPERSARRRPRGSRRRARFVELVAGTLIRVGGIGTILSVALIFAFLLWVVTPLFLGARGSVAAGVDATPHAERSAPLLAGIDEHKRLAWTLAADGALGVWRVDDGSRLELVTPFPAAPTAVALAPEGAAFALGFADGTVRVGRVGFRSRYHTRAERPDAWARLDVHGRATDGNELIELQTDGTLLATALELVLATEQRAFDGVRIVALDRSTSATRDALLVLGASGELVLLELESRENMLTGEVEWEARRHAITIEPAADGTLPERVLLNEGADGAYLVWRGGRLQHYDLRDPDAARLEQSSDVAPGDAEVTAAAFLIGKTTFVVADSAGALSAWFPVKRTDGGAHGGSELVCAHTLTTSGPPVLALATSARGRIVAAATGDGNVQVWNVTNDRAVVTLAPPASAGSFPLQVLAFAAKEDALLGLSDGRVVLWNLALGHPEAGVAALFRPVWYEGYAGPEHVWQSSSGTDSFEPKLGLWPLVFGTLKATFYSMIFAVPIALLAALYTSQFLSARVRAPLKAAVEMMASLPSVVLGFLAGIVIAPYVETVVPAILAAFFTIPLALVGGAQLVRLLPERWNDRIEGPLRLAGAAIALAAGCAFAFWSGPLVERVFFGSDLRGWLDGRHGDALGGWLLLVTPFAAVLVAWLVARNVEPRLHVLTREWSRGRCARLRALLFGGGLVVAALVAWCAASALGALGFDPRGSVFDTYVQRNSLIVGGMMGFAVIPIIFTIADDALTAVPAHLKLASIGAGATPWQTALRVVLPTAASGIFSAVMIGLGRAVGETMIVLMATGNTPVMSWNVFDGFRTLSANIAVELPEAVKNSTHYRTLFLAALCLFAITFAFNTVAEIVRQRYRRKAARL